MYDLADRVVSQREYTGTEMSGGTLRSYTDFTYADKTNYLTGVKHFSPLGTQNIGYRYGDISKSEMPDQIYGVTWNGAEKVSYTYDPLGRLTNRKVASFSNAYTYEDVGEDKTTTLVQSVVTPAGTYSYTYDNIILDFIEGVSKTAYSIIATLAASFPKIIGNMFLLTEAFFQRFGMNLQMLLKQLL